MEIETLLETIRDAALQPEAWDAVQRQTDLYFQSSCSQLASADHANGNAFLSRTPKLPELDHHIATLACFSEPVLYASRNPGWRRFVDYDFITEEEMAKSLFYRENEQFDIRYRLALRLLDTTDRSTAILWFWPGKAGPPQSSELEKLDLIQEHLRMAAHISNTLGQSLGAEKGIVQALANCGVAASIVEPDGRLIYANEKADGIFQARDGIADFGGTLALMQNGANTRFTEALAAAAKSFNGNIAERPGGVLVVERPSSLPGYVISVSALSRGHQFLGRTKALLLVCIVDPLSEAPLRSEILKSAFGLTTTEADIAVTFANGSTVDEMADRRGIKLSTVRQHLKSIKAKTKTNRQADLMRVLLSIATL